MSVNENAAGDKGGDMGRPNVLFLFTDQQRWDTIAQAGYGHMITPNLDWLAEHGMRFDSAYVPCPLCAPTRAGIVTGCFPRRTGVKTNGLWVPDDTNTWPKVFTEAGYDTCAVGKMHAARGTTCAVSQGGWSPRTSMQPLTT